MTHADSIWVNTLEAHADSLQHKVDLLQAKLDDLQGKTEFLTNVVETANDGVSNQLSAANNLLALVAVIMAVAGIWLGIYIAKKKHQIDIMASIVDNKKKVVVELAKVVDEKKDDVDAIAIKTEELDKKIHGDLTGLYKDLRKEETNALLDRLILEPFDICNVSDLLLAREIENSGYYKLKEAFLKLLKEQKGELPENIDKTYRLRYVVLFFQHFCYEALIDEEVAPSIIEYLDAGCQTAFKRDIIKSTTELCKAVSSENAKFNKEDVLVEFLLALNHSWHRNYKELRKIIEENITPNELLQSALERCKKDKVVLQLFEETKQEEGKTATQYS